MYCIITAIESVGTFVWQLLSIGFYSISSISSLLLGQSLEIRVMKIMNEINWGHVRIAHSLYSLHLYSSKNKRISQKLKS